MARLLRFDELPLLAISRGEISGVSALHKFGRAQNADNGVATDIWDGANASINQPVWLAPTAARIHTLTSASDDDTGGETPGTGAKVVRVFGLPSWTEPETYEDVVMNGTTGVAMTQAMVIIHRMVVTSWGSTGPNAGAIQAVAASDATITAAIHAGEGQTQMAIYGIPANYGLYLTGIYASVLRATAATADIELGATDPVNGDATKWIDKFSLAVQSSANAIFFPFDPPRHFAGPLIMKIKATASLNDSDISAGFSGILMPD